MTNEQAKSELMQIYMSLSEEKKKAIDMAIKALVQEPKWNRLYSWLNDMRYGIAPDETVTDIDERNVRTAQVDMLDEIMEWMIEPQEISDRNLKMWEEIYAEEKRREGSDKE